MAMKKLFQDAEYVQGQIDSLRALILAIGRAALDLDDFREHALHHLEMVRTTYLPMPVSETRLRAVDDFEKWVRAVTVQAPQDKQRD